MNSPFPTTLQPRQRPQDISPPTVLRCADTADFLTALPLLTGLALEPGLFIVLFRGKRASQSLRLDLPATCDAATIRSFLNSVCSILNHSGAASNHPALVLVTAELFEAEASNWRTISDAILQRFRREGWKMRDFAVVAADAWATLTGKNADVPRGLEELSTSTLARSERLPPFTPHSLADLGSLPPADAKRAQLVAHHLAELDTRAAAEECAIYEPPIHDGAPSWVHGAAHLAGGCLGKSDAAAAAAAAALEPRLVARLARLCETLDGWIVCVLTALTRPQFVIEMFESGGAARLLDTHHLSLTTQQRQTASSTQSSVEPIVALIRALADERPDPGKLERVTEVLRELAAQLPAHRRAGILALLAWSWWHIGMQSLAQRFIELAQKSAPHDPTVQLVSTLNDEPPQWLLRALRQPETLAPRLHPNQ